MTTNDKRSRVLPFETGVRKRRTDKYVLRLFIAGTTPRSTRAVANIRDICERNLNGRYDLEVIDIYQKPAVAIDEQILAAPTLVKRLPLPLRRFIGDLSDTERILVGMEIAATGS
jgi:circadian clock protein KaiB